MCRMEDQRNQKKSESEENYSWFLLSWFPAFWGYSLDSMNVATCILPSIIALYLHVPCYICWNLLTWIYFDFFLQNFGWKIRVLSPGDNGSVSQKTFKNFLILLVVLIPFLWSSEIHSFEQYCKNVFDLQKLFYRSYQMEQEDFVRLNLMT